jgi:Zn-finger nucleic acid-binding protein
MNAAYRATTLTCPGCAEPLAPTHAGDAVVDCCTTCGGVWIDWDDGELSATIKRVPPPTSPARGPRTGSAACPRCHAPLGPEHYGTSHAEIFRCGDCIGAFVPRASIALLLVGEAPTGAPASEKSFFEALLDRLRSFTRRAP